MGIRVHPVLGRFTFILALLGAGLIGASFTGLISNSAARQMGSRLAIPDAFLKPGTLVDVGGYRLNLYSYGTGGPTIVLDAGAGWGAVGWAGIQERLARAAGTRVISYDRAAMNFSDIGPVEREPDRTVRDLHEMLRRAEIPGPYVLVGWSMGGMIVRWFAARYPEETAAVVTVDGSTVDFADPAADPEVYAWLPRAIRQFQEARTAAEKKLFDADPDLFRRCSRLINPLQSDEGLRRALEDRARDPRVYAHWIYFLEHAREFDDACRRERRSLGAIPLRVLVAGEHLRQTGKSDADFVRDSFRVASLSEDGLMTAVPGTTHGMHLDKPEALIGLMVEAVQAARSSRGPLKPPPPPGVPDRMGSSPHTSER